MNQIQYITGDATNPIGEGIKVICHVCNDIGGWGSGFVLALSKKWKKPELSYRLWFKNNTNPNSKMFFNTFKLGMLQSVKVEDDIHVVNMIAQQETRKTKAVPIDYNAVRTCLNKVGNFILTQEDKKISIHMPRIGCGLAGGKWEVIEEIINETLIAKDIPVSVYSLQGDTSCCYFL